MQFESSSEFHATFPQSRCINQKEVESAARHDKLKHIGHLVAAFL
jgi:hypothetical protein